MTCFQFVKRMNGNSGISFKTSKQSPSCFQFVKRMNGNVINREIDGSRSMGSTFPFIRFTNWKQVYLIGNAKVLLDSRFHSYASRIGSKDTWHTPLAILKFPFIRFTNWKQDDSAKHSVTGNTKVSIHTLHELEASHWIHSFSTVSLWFPFIRFTNWKQEFILVFK